MMRPFRRGRRPSAHDADLTVCGSCGSDSVIPTKWAERGARDWWMRLRCGACGASREVVVSDVAALRYDAELDRGTHEIARALWRLERDRLTEVAEAFAIALPLDLVDADDFAR
jgi:hypothetical protein